MLTRSTVTTGTVNNKGVGFSMNLSYSLLRIAGLHNGFRTLWMFGPKASHDLAYPTLHDPEISPERDPSLCYRQSTSTVNIV